MPGRSTGVSLLLALFVAGCAGPSIQTIHPNAYVPEQFDGALIDYALPKAEQPVKAQYDAKSALLLLTFDGLNTVADSQNVYTLAYNHAGLSTDEVEIQLEGGMLKIVSSSTKDQTIEAIQGINAILSQVGATKSALAPKSTSKAVTATQPPKAKEPTPADCVDDLAVAGAANVTYGYQLQTVTLKGPTLAAKLRCTIKLTIDVGRPKRIFRIAGFPTVTPSATSDDPADIGDICNQAVCFRLAGLYAVKATAVLRYYVKDETGKETGAINDMKDPGGEGSFSVTSTKEILAPSKGSIGFVKFNRRAFVQNKTSITFSNGIVTDFKATDPSELVGFLQLPNEFLKGVVLTVPLVR